MKKRIDTDKVVALARKGKSNKDIALATGIHFNTVGTVLKRYALNEKEVQLFDKSKVSILKDLQRRIINSISDDDLVKMNAYQKTTMLGILIDKERLIAGQSTSNQQVLFHIVEQACKNKYPGSESDHAPDEKDDRG